MNITNLNLQELSIEEQKNVEGGRTIVQWAVYLAGAITKCAINGELIQADNNLRFAESF